MNENMENSITAGKYIIINKKQYCKLHLLADNSSVYIGKDKILLNGIIGYRFWSTFKMVPKNSNREFTLTLCKPEEMVESDGLLRGNIKSGSDNRNIWDDGNSQLLSTEEIVEMRDSGLSSRQIVGCLVENSKTFHNKTGYSQEKYLKKKGAKYFEYITIKKPTLRLISEMFFSKDPAKILGLRTDSLSQIITAVNLQPDGTYVLYENGSQGLVAATILNYLSENGKLIYITSGKHPQQHAILAMNFNQKLKCLKCISMTKMNEELENFQIGQHEEIFEHSGSSKEPVDLISVPIDLEQFNLSKGEGVENGLLKEKIKDLNYDIGNSRKRKTEYSIDSSVIPVKKPRWELEAEEALHLLKSKTTDALIIVCKEYPINLFSKLLYFLEYSRPFVLFNLCREPLVQLYCELKARHDIINLRLTETWLRSYQVLPDRTRPDVLMSGNSGHLLTGTTVNNL